MKYDQYGVMCVDENDIINALHKNPDLDYSNFKLVDPDQYNNAVKMYYESFPVLERYSSSEKDLSTFDREQQSNWYMPKDYLEFDIVTWVLDQCNTEVEKQRVGQELILYAERELLNLLRYLKYFVDTMRANNVIWGLGRGSSVSSYVLYLIGVHKINSIYYDLPIEEFLK